MKPKKNVILGIVLFVLISFNLVGCGFDTEVNNHFKDSEVSSNHSSTQNNNQSDKNELNNDLEENNLKMIKVSDIKKKYGAESSSSEYLFKPFYNVEQTTEFTFRFNSNVDPFKAITVHTDPDCEENSTIFQWNDGYKTENGVDVIVKPGTPVLESTSRLDYVDEDMWGYAQIYYICVRYDLESEEVKKLDNPIIIPFTVKKEIATPYAYFDIDNNGLYSISWDSVENAKEYRIYKSYVSKDRYDRAKYAYTGENLVLQETVDASTLKYKPGKDMYQDNCSWGYNSEYVTMQNVYTDGAFYITAVDKNGKESFYSNPITPEKYASELPYKLNKFNGSQLNELPETVSVLYADESTKIDYPINFYKIEKMESKQKNIQYKYEVPGTRLTGYVFYTSATNEYPNEKLSGFEMKRAALIDMNISRNIPVDVNTLVDDTYNNSIIELNAKVNYPKEAKISLDPAQGLIRADMEVARMFNGGAYTVPLDTIESYVMSENPEYVVVHYDDGSFAVVKAKDVNSGKTEQPPKTGTQEKENNKKPGKIDNTNYVEEQKESTKEQVKKADEEKVFKTEYPIFADNAQQEYLALQLINCEEQISLKAFPKYQVQSELFDDLLYIWYQNPYIIGFDINSSRYDYNKQTLKVKYVLDKKTIKKYQMEVAKKADEVVNKIIKNNMSDTEKVIAIWDYLEKNAEYNQDALETVMNKPYINPLELYPNCWNTYGILCEGLGVCQSYAYAFNILAYESGLESVMATGSAQNVGHAWNAVKLDGKWYMVDTTNNSNAVGIPYWICNASTEFIYENGFRLDGGFVDGENYLVFERNDDSKDWYNINNLKADTLKECVEIWNRESKNSKNVYIKYTISELEAKTFIEKFSAEALKLGVSSDKLERTKVNYAYGVLGLFGE